MRAPLIIAVTSGALFFAGPTLGNPYADCVLQHMGTAQNEAAVGAIERACIDNTSIVIPPDDTFAGDLNADVGNFNMGHGGAVEYGLLVTLKNTTNFDITQVVVTIRNKDTQQITRYPVDAFNAPLPPGDIITKLGEPALSQIIKPGETRRFFVHIDEAVAKPSDFGKKFTWGATPTKGIPTN